MANSFEHFGEVPDDNHNLWRYTSLAKLLNILNIGDKNEFIAYRASELDDDYEGTLSDRASEEIERSLTRDYLKETYEELDLIRAQYTPNAGEEYVDQYARSEASAMTSQIRRMVERMREVTFANCWSDRKYEDSNMWRSYTSKSDGVVIRTNLDKIRNSIENYEGKLYLGNVEYIKFDDKDMKRDAVAPFFYKQKQFEAESEFRIIITDYKKKYFNLSSGVDGLPDKPTKDKRPIQVNATNLIEEIRVHPESREYLKQVVENVVEETDIQVNQSTLRSSLF